MMESETVSKEAVFEQDKMETYTSEHYVFHYSKGSLAEEDILQIVKTQEESYVKICGALAVQYPERIHYYFTDFPLEIGRVFWEEGTPCNGCALCGRNKIYAVYNESIKCIGSHEDTHLISFLINFPESDFIVEGLATSFDGLWWGVPNEVWASYYKNKYPELSVKELLDNDAFAECGCVKTYPIAGAFTRFLIDGYGMERYLEIYKYDGCAYEDAFVRFFQASLTDLENAFWGEMESVVFDAAVLEKMLRDEGF